MKKLSMISTTAIITVLITVAAVNNVHETRIIPRALATQEQQAEASISKAVMQKNTDAQVYFKLPDAAELKEVNERLQPHDIEPSPFMQIARGDFFGSDKEDIIIEYREDRGLGKNFIVFENMGDDYKHLGTFSGNALYLSEKAEKAVTHTDVKLETITHHSAAIESLNGDIEYLIYDPDARTLQMERGS